ncbi:MAG: SMP-30/gluconolactonase/LRE family protein [Gammaproteobacteria bacterium]|nr:SMP-30/gluconolactonase/LRE family protein [Gammaproteobacteria bacterium]
MTKDPRAARLAAEIGIPGAGVRTATFVAFTEGPVWSADRSVYFTDLWNDRILRFVLKGRQASEGGRFEVFRAPAGRPVGMVFDAEGRLIVCEGELGDHRRVTRTERDGGVTVLADRYRGRRLNSPNDVDVDTEGRVYFTDPRYTDRTDMELDHESVYRIDPDGTLTRIIDDVVRPNGIAVSADQRTLYVVDNDNSGAGGTRKIYAYNLLIDGSTAGRRVFHDFGAGRGGDGMCLDELGNVYIAAGLNTPNPPAEDDSVPAGVHIFSPEGTQLGVISVPMDLITNVCFGDTDLRTLYITCGHTLFYVRLKVRGYVLWPRPED